MKKKTSLNWKWLVIQSPWFKETNCIKINNTYTLVLIDPIWLKLMILKIRSIVAIFHLECIVNDVAVTSIQKSHTFAFICVKLRISHKNKQKP